MANEGKRCYCRCIQDMRMQIGKEELTIFHHNQIYACMVRTGDKEVSFYKIYGAEFKEYFRFVKYKSSDEKL